MQYSPDIVLTGYAIKWGSQKVLPWPISLGARYIATVGDDQVCSGTVPVGRYYKK